MYIFICIVYIELYLYFKGKKNYIFFGIIFKENIFKNYIIVIILIVILILFINWSKDGLNFFK